jgi:hypothetical protein
MLSRVGGENGFWNEYGSYQKYQQYCYTGFSFVVGLFSSDPPRFICELIGTITLEQFSTISI